jgi:2-amino-4-hydroxy-6-hydroxymethyldihydropteridine diphosphokinase
MITCYLGLGSNLDNPKQQIKLAIKALQALPCSRFKAVSPVYHSMPAGVSTEQPMYCNAVVLLETDLSAHDLLKQCNLIENQQKRLRLKRLDARTIDIDILLYGAQTIDTPNLTIPHPRLHLRDFVLVPLLDLWPEADLPDGRHLNHCLETLTTRYIAEPSNIVLGALTDLK